MVSHDVSQASRYAREKFQLTTSTLATEGFSLPIRLGHAFAHLLNLLPQDLPPELWRTVAEIRVEMLREKPMLREGSLMVTARTMDDGTAQRIAEQLVSINDTIAGPVPLSKRPRKPKQSDRQ